MVEKKSHMVTTRMDPELKAKMDKAASASGRSLSGEIQWRLDDYDRLLDGIALLKSDERITRALPRMIEAVRRAANYKPKPELLYHLDEETGELRQEGTFDQQEIYESDYEVGILVAASQCLSTVANMVKKKRSPHWFAFVMIGTKTAIENEGPLEKLTRLEADLLGPKFFKNFEEFRARFFEYQKLFVSIYEMTEGKMPKDRVDRFTSAQRWLRENAPEVAKPNLNHPHAKFENPLKSADTEESKE